mmetsp:Transcript_16355/g.43084  ORF Transcript_16355/g.43084 Transcript_16355/m.43084 type:complete len:115 (+) Transcript_16355:130-474(+)
MRLVALTLLGCTDALLPALRGASMTALRRPVAVAPLSTCTSSALRRPAVPSMALRASNDDGNRKLEIPEQPEYDVEGINFKELLKGDPTTLTLVGFGLIAFNFFVLAGFGSGGL